MKKYDAKTYWDSKARTFQDDPVRAACTTSPLLNACIERTQRRALDECFQYLKQTGKESKGRVLDFGCGSGRWTDALSHISGEYVGVDISEEMIGMCRARYRETRFETMDGACIPFPSDYFDVAFSVAVIHHSNFDEQGALVQELARVVKPGGLLFLFEGVGEEAINREFPRPIDQWIDLVSSYGFNCISRHHYEYWPVTRLCDDKVGLGSPLRGLVLRLDKLFSPLLSERLACPTSGRVALLLQNAGE